MQKITLVYRVFQNEIIQFSIEFVSSIPVQSMDEFIFMQHFYSLLQLTINLPTNVSNSSFQEIKYLALKCFFNFKANGQIYRNHILFLPVSRKKVCGFWFKSTAHFITVRLYKSLLFYVCEQNNKEKKDTIATRRHYRNKNHIFLDRKMFCIHQRSTPI